MKMRALLSLLCLALITSLGMGARAADLQGADRCLRCHGDKPEMGDFFHTPHAVASDVRSPMGQAQQCDACHGDSTAHIEGGRTVKPAITFNKNDAASVRHQNGVCLNCHLDQARSHWQGSAHERSDTRCVDCHRSHRSRDPVLTKTMEQEVCLACHPRQRSELLKLSKHPFRNGSVSCSDCHNAHGAMTDHALVGMTLNQTCYRCHADKRGPYLWEHAPVREDCSVCHVSHGSNQPALLTSRVPFLCQSCHSATGHPSVALNSSQLNPLAANSTSVLLQGCLSCHPAVHGSNHPSGVLHNR